MKHAGIDYLAPVAELTALRLDREKTYLPKSGLNQNGPQQARWGCSLKEASSWQKGQWRHQRLSFNFQLLGTNNLKQKRPGGRELCSSFPVATLHQRPHTRQKGESRWVSKESDVLASYLCWGIRSLAWPDWPKDSIYSVSQQTHKPWLVLEWCLIPYNYFDCFTSPKGIRTSSGARLSWEWFTTRVMQVKGGALT